MMSRHAGPEQSPILEAWYRAKLPGARFDISSSGVQPYSFGSLRMLLSLECSDLDDVILGDSLTFGGQAVRKAIANRYAGGDVARVMVTHGSSEAIALIMQALLEPGDRILVADPIYHSLRTFAEQQGCDVTRVPVRAFAENGGGAQCVAQHINTGTKAVIVSFPHNPTGMTLSPDSARKLLRDTEQAGCLLLWDAAMAELPMNSSETLDALPLSPRMISFGTLSKAFGLPGLRVGWCIAAPDLLDRTLPLRDRTTLFLSPLIELIAARAIEHGDELIGPRLAQARDNLEYLDSFISRHADLMSWNRPEGGVCGMLEIRGIADTRVLCERLLAETGVLLVPGSAFERPTQVRVGYGGDPVELREALDLLSGFIRRTW